jgi:hypothetical protein
LKAPGYCIDICDQFFVSGVWIYQENDFVHSHPPSESGAKESPVRISKSSVVSSRIAKNGCTCEGGHALFLIHFFQIHEGPGSWSSPCREGYRRPHQVF